MVALSQPSTGSGCGEALKDRVVPQEEKMSVASSEWSVDELVQRCLKLPTDEEAWQEFVRRFHTTIRLNVQKTYHRKARDEAERRTQIRDDEIEDLVQAVYSRLVEDHCRALKRFEGEHENSMYQYLGMIAVNVVRDRFRELKAQKRPRISHSIEDLLEGGSTGIADAELLSRSGSSLTLNEIQSALRKAAAGRNRDRDILIFQLHFLHGMTSEEIIQVLGLEMTITGVNSIKSRILRKLRSLLGPAHG